MAENFFWGALCSFVCFFLSMYRTHSSGEDNTVVEHWIRTLMAQALRRTSSPNSNLVSRARPFTQSLCWERVWSNSHSSLVSTGPGISWTGNWFRVAVTSLYKQCGWKKIARKVFATRQLFSRAIMRAARRKLLNRTSLTIKTSCPQWIQLC